MSELLRFECLHCGKSLSAKPKFIGRSTRCPGCLCMVKVPSPEVKTEDFFKFMEDAEPTAKPPQRHPRDEPYRHTKADDQGGAAERLRPCPACGEEIKQIARKCRYCGEVLDPSLRQDPDWDNSSRQRSSSQPTADLGKRFLGALADSLMGFVFLIPGFGLMFAGGISAGNDPGPPVAIVGAGMLLLIVGILAFIGLNLYLLATRSQSIGKCLLKTQIYDYETDVPASFVKSFVMRGLVNGLIGAIPFIGSIYALVDICFIFGEERRCLHDQIAGTYVVDIS